jgi:NAD-dependent SIR2 family protein deacetylase
MDKTIFIIGAGMSAECGAPVIRDFLKPDFLKMVASKQRKVISNFLNSNYFSSNNITIEDALKKIDTEIKNGKTSSEYSIKRLVKIKTILVNYIIEILSVCGDNLMEELRTTSIDKPYLVLSKKKDQEILYRQKLIGQLTRELEHLSSDDHTIPIIGINAKKWLETYSSILLLLKPNDVVINLNFDQFFEIALLDLPQDVIIDYGIDHFQLSPDEDFLCEGILTKLTRPPKSAGVRKISLFKIHGSLNWGICSGCNSLISIVRTPIIRLKKYIQQLQKMEKKFKEKNLCCTQFAVDPLIVIPTIYSKRGYENHYLKELSKAAIAEISNADNLVFLGYSFSDSDQFVRHLFEEAEKNRKNKPWEGIRVINRSIAPIKENYERIFKKVEFIRSTPSKFIQEELRMIDPKKCTLNNCIMKKRAIRVIKV